MELKVKVEEIGGLVSKAQKAAKINSHFALTTFIQIDSDGKKLSVTMHDGLNFFTFKKAVEAAKAQFVLKADVFFKLFSKTTSKEITLKDEGNFISFKGNGSYKLDKEVDKSTEEGIIILFPQVEVKKKYKIKVEQFREDMKRVLPGIAETQQSICLTGVYANKDILLAADPKRAIRVKSSLVKEDSLFSPELINLIGLSDAKEISFGNALVGDVKYYVVESDDAYIVGTQVLGIEKFPAETVEGIFKSAEGVSAQVDKASLLAALERFLVFSDKIDEQGVEIAVTKDSLIFRKESIGEEILPLEKVVNFAPFACKTDVVILKKLIEGAVAEKLTFIFNNPAFVVFEYDNTKLLLSTIVKGK